MDKAKNTSEATLNAVISKAVAYLMAHHIPRPLSQGALARLSHVSQGTICMNLKGERGWSIEVLEKICPPLGSTLEDLIPIGKELQSGSEHVFPWPGLVRDTAPHSEARLLVLVQVAAGSRTQLARLVNLQSVQDNLPSEYADYLSGKITDGSMYFKLCELLEA